MTAKTETCTGTLHLDEKKRWFARTQLVGKVYLDENLQSRPHPSVEGVEVAVTLFGVNPIWTVIDYHFI